jgi:hypothetical protein
MSNWEKDIFTNEIPLSNEERLELFRRKNWTAVTEVTPVTFVPKHVRKFQILSTIGDIPEFLKRQAE